MKAKSLLKRMSEGFVRFLALSSILQIVAANEQPKKESDLLFAESYKPLHNPMTFKEYENNVREDQVIGDIFNVYDKSSSDEKLKYIDYLSGLIKVSNSHRLLMSFDPVTSIRNVENKIPKKGFVVKIIDQNGVAHQITALELYSYAVYSSYINVKLIEHEKYELYNEEKHIINLSKYLHVDKIDLMVEGYFHNYALYLVEQKRSTIDKAFSYSRMGKALHNMIQFHDAIRKGTSPAQVNEAYKTLRNAKLFIERDMKLAFDENIFPENERPLFHRLWTSLYVEKYYRSETLNIHAEFEKLYAKHAPGEISLAGFEEINDALVSLDDDLKRGIHEWKKLLNETILPFITVTALFSIYLAIGKLSEVFSSDNASRADDPKEGSVALQTKKIKLSKAKEPGESDAEKAARMKAFEGHLKDLNNQYAERMKNEDAERAKRASIRNEKTAHDKKLEDKYHSVYRMLVEIIGQSKILPNQVGLTLNKAILEGIILSETIYYVKDTKEIDQVRLANDILVKMGYGKDKARLEGFNKEFLEVYTKGPDAVQVAKAQAEAKVRLEKQEAERNQRESNALIVEKVVTTPEERKLPLIPKQKGKLQAPPQSSSGSSSTSVSLIAFNSQVDRNKAKELFLQLAKLVDEYKSDSAISNDLHELKHDLIKIAAVMEQLSMLGCSPVLNGLVNYARLMVMRNGAVHLLEITVDEKMQIAFYQQALIQLGTISALNIVEKDIEKNISDLLQKINSSHFVRVGFDAIVSEEIYTLFEADCAQYKGDHEKKARSDVIDEIQTRTEGLKLSGYSSKKYTMLYAECAELYSQLKNAGIAIPGFAQKMIANKNHFTHHGVGISPSSSSRSASVKV